MTKAGQSASFFWSRYQPRIPMDDPSGYIYWGLKKPGGFPPGLDGP
jgi:uncharacterized protein (DUF3820 family)